MSKEEVNSTEEKADQEQTSAQEGEELSEAIEAQAEEEKEAEDKKKSSKKKSIFSKGNKQKEQLEELEQEIGELKDKYIRLYAEFDNFRKRTSRERMDLMKTAGQDVVQDLLPVLDDIDRAADVVGKRRQAGRPEKRLRPDRTEIQKDIGNQGTGPDGFHWKTLRPGMA